MQRILEKQIYIFEAKFGQKANKKFRTDKKFEYNILYIVSSFLRNSVMDRGRPSNPSK